MPARDVGHARVSLRVSLTNTIGDGSMPIRDSGDTRCPQRLCMSSPAGERFEQSMPHNAPAAPPLSSWMTPGEGLGDGRPVDSSTAARNRWVARESALLPGVVAGHQARMETKPHRTPKGIPSAKNGSPPSCHVIASSKEPPGERSNKEANVSEPAWSNAQRF